ncbi:MAG: peptidoglycan editing factor PgeF [Clostridium sp.]|nr:peptidoglycan editing factor PgeF [Clostridium sp.]MBQ8999687.1 peptidoglycan editing factor PgeF [Clostridium sp.]
MEKYIEVKEIKEKVPFVNLAITKKEIDAKNIEDLKSVFSGIFTLDNLTSNIQIHSDIVNVIDESNVASKAEGDALITNLKNVPLLVFTADCVPVAIIDKTKKVISVVHAGWRGTYEQIARKAVEKMMDKYDSKPEDMICVIGPSIGECCYEVSEDLYNKFNDRFYRPTDELCKIVDNKYYLNLWNINTCSLEKVGVLKENIINLNICTNCNSDKFYSYRAHNQTPKRIGMLLEIIG